MKSLFLLGLVAVLTTAGCFSSNADMPGVDSLGQSISVTPLGTTEASDIAVDGSGNIVVYGFDEGWENSLRILERGSGTLLATVPVSSETWGMSLALTGANEALISDGSWSTTLVRLDTGETLSVSGMEQLAEETPAYLDGSVGGDLGDPGDGEVVAIECEPNRGSPINIWGGSGANRTLLRSVRFDGSVDSVMAVAYASDRDLLFAATERGLVAISTETGEVTTFYADTGEWWASGLAYDASRGTLLRVEWQGSGSVVAEYEL